METKYARRALRTSLLAGVLLLGACTVPTLDQMSKACDDQHACADGWVCSPVDSKCYEKGKEPATPECVANETRACTQTYAEVGECKLGTQTCGADRRWGTCVGAVGPSAEICDGKDNDCDAQVDAADSSLIDIACPKQSGVCVGSKKACVAGELQDCTKDTYFAHDAAYMEDESLCTGDSGACEGRRGCDGKDNDCDGEVDEGLDYDRDRYGRLGVSCDLNPGGTPADCDDADATIHPGATETCNGWNDSCGEATYLCELGQLQVCSASVQACSQDCSQWAACGQVEICNGLDDNGKDFVDEDLVGTNLLAGSSTSTRSLAVTVIPPGDFLVGYIQTTTPAGLYLQRVRSSMDPYAGPKITVLAGTAATKVAVAPRHVAWIEKSGAATVLRAAAITRDLTVLAAFDAGLLGTDVESLVARSLDSVTTVVAASSSTGDAVFYKALRDNRVVAEKKVTFNAGVSAKSLSFGKAATGELLLFYEKVEAAPEKHVIAWRVLDADGMPTGAESTVVPPASANHYSPAGTDGALAFVEKVSTSAAQIFVAPIASATAVGTAVRADSAPTPVEAPAISALPSGPNQSLLVTWIERDSEIRTGNPPTYFATLNATTARRATLKADGSIELAGWESYFFQSKKNVRRIVTASDGIRFAVISEGDNTSGVSESLFKFSCPGPLY